MFKGGRLVGESSVLLQVHLGMEGVAYVKCLEVVTRVVNCQALFSTILMEKYNHKNYESSLWKK